MGLQGKLEHVLWDYAGKWYGKYPAYLIMHPKTYFDLCHEISSKDRNDINYFEPDPNYKGIPVLRSYDCEENVFYTSLFDY